MLDRILEQLPALMTVATDETVSKNAKTTVQNCLLSFEKNTLAKSVVAVLKLFKNGTEAVCSETNPTINKILPVVTKLLRGLEEKKDDLPAIKELKKRMKGFEQMSLMKARAAELLYTAVSDVHVSVHVKQEKDVGKVQESEESVLALPVAPQDMDIQNVGKFCETENSASDDPPEKKTQESDDQPAKKKLKLADTDEWLNDVMCVGESRIANTDLV